MKKFGFGKKREGDEESNRSALFGSRSKNKSPNAPANPYATPPSASDPYTNAKLSAGVGGINRVPSPSNGSPARQGGYGGFSGSVGGYTSDRYGAQSGYGADRYGVGAGGAQSSEGGCTYRPGGYGGLGRGDSQD